MFLLLPPWPPAHPHSLVDLDRVPVEKRAQWYLQTEVLGYLLLLLHRCS